MITAAADIRQPHLDHEIARLEQQPDALLSRNPTRAPNQKLLRPTRSCSSTRATSAITYLTCLKTPGVATGRTGLRGLVCAARWMRCRLGMSERTVIPQTGSGEP